MLRRRTVLAGSAVIVVFAIVVVWLAAGRIHNSVNPAAFAQIQPGMPRDQVIEILGGPPDMGTGAGGMNGWMGSDAILHIWLDKSGRVTNKIYTEQPAHYRLRLIWRKIVSLM